MLFKNGTDVELREFRSKTTNTAVLVVVVLLYCCIIDAMRRRCITSAGAFVGGNSNIWNSSSLKKNRKMPIPIGSDVIQRFKGQRNVVLICVSRAVQICIGYVITAA
jgi:hypothetical protein